MRKDPDGIYTISRDRRMKNNKEIYIKQYQHGYNYGFLYKDIAPTITISSWEHNNFVIEIEDEDNNTIR